jgi:hypothetical protein
MASRFRLCMGRAAAASASHGNCESHRLLPRAAIHAPMRLTRMAVGARQEGLQVSAAGGERRERFHVRGGGAHRAPRLDDGQAPLVESKGCRLG